MITYVCDTMCNSNGYLWQIHTVNWKMCKPCQLTPSIAQSGQSGWSKIVCRRPWKPILTSHVFFFSYVFSVYPSLSHRYFSTIYSQPSTPLSPKHLNVFKPSTIPKFGVHPVFEIDRGRWLKSHLRFEGSDYLKKRQKMGFHFIAWVNNEVIVLVPHM